MKTNFYQLYIKAEKSYKQTGNKSVFLETLETLKVRAEKEENQAWHAYIDATIFYWKDKYKEALNLIEDLLEKLTVKGLEADPELVCMSLFEKGFILGQLGQSKEEIAVYDEIERRYGKSENPELQIQVAKSLFNKGVTLRTLKQSKEEFAVYDEIERRYGKSENPELQFQVAQSLINKGVILGKLKQSKEEIAVYDEIERRYGKSENPAIEEVVSRTMFWKGFRLYQDGKKEEGYKFIINTYRKSPTTREENFRYFCSVSGKDFETEHAKLFPREGKKKIPEKEQLPELQGFITQIREAYRAQSKDFLEKKEKFENKRAGFLENKSNLDENKSLFFVLRRWNSYTPSIPMEEDEYIRGGGYFLWHKGFGVVIDPGYDFLKNFHEAGGRICDIDAIVLTHAHNDHTIEFETLLSLIHEYNDKQKEQGGGTKKIDLYLNNGAFKKFAGLLNLRHRGGFGKITTLNAGYNIELFKDIHLAAVNAFHDEIISKDQCIGVRFDITIGDETRQLILTSDTGLFPLRLDVEKPTSDLSEGKEVWEGYGKKKSDLMVIHIGSIKPEEFEIKVDPKPETACYPNHLGIIGTARLITMCKPELAVISEFGEEMREFRKDLIRGLNDKVILPFFKSISDPKNIPHVVPGDLAFVYNIEDKTILGIKEDWIKATDIDFGDVRDVGDYEKCNPKVLIDEICYFSKKGKDQILKNYSAFECYVKDFRNHKEHKKGIYFKS